MNLLEKALGNKFKKTHEIKKMHVAGQIEDTYVVYAVPLEYLYYNDQNGRINTTYRKYQSENGTLVPEPGDSEYNSIFEKFIFDSNKQALLDTIVSIKEKTQQEPGVVLADGRIIDGNRRFTALRKIEAETGIKQDFNVVILQLDAKSKTDEKTIKELELDLQLGKEERVNYDPIDRIFDVYETIEINKLMTVEEYKKASGAKTTRGINRDIRLANLIIRFIEIVSPGDNPIDKFYLARDLKLDGPIEEIESTITGLKNKNSQAITEAVLVHLAVSKTDPEQQDSTRVMRDLKKNILKNPENLKYYMDAVDDKVDIVIDAFEENPIQSSNDIKKIVEENDKLQENVKRMISSTNRLVYKGQRDAQRKKAVLELEDIRDGLLELDAEDFSELTTDEFLDAKDLITEINDILFKLKREINL